MPWGTFLSAVPPISGNAEAKTFQVDGPNRGLPVDVISSKEGLFLVLETELDPEAVAAAAEGRPSMAKRHYRLEFLVTPLSLPLPDTPMIKRYIGIGFQRSPLAGVPEIPLAIYQLGHRSQIPQPDPGKGARMIPSCLVDLSHHNRDRLKRGQTLDFAKAKTAGLRAAFLKTTQGTGFVDPAREAFARDAAVAGVWVGYYAFLTGEASFKDQVDHLLSTLGIFVCNEGPLLALDAEPNPDGPSVTLPILRGAAELLHEDSGDWPWVYPGVNIQEALAAELAEGRAPADDPLSHCPLWWPKYSADPRGWPHLWSTWTAWQYTGDNEGPGPRLLPGLEPGAPLDLSHFYGHEDELRAAFFSGA